MGFFITGGYLMKVRKLILPFMIICLFIFALTKSANADAATWHTGTPKVIRGNWYYNGSGEQKAFITYTKTMSSGELFKQSDNNLGYYKLPGYGLKHIKYKALRHHIYLITGIQYSPKGASVQFDGQRLSYKVKAPDKKNLYFYKGFRHYTRKPNFKIVKQNQQATSNQ
jgi:hypothetical protein